MSVRTRVNSALGYIDEISTREFKSVAFVCIIVVALNVLVMAYSFGYVNGIAACGYPSHFTGGHRDFFHDFLRLRIEVALLIIAIGLWSRRVLGFLISLLATMFVGYQYGLWYLDTKRWLREMNVSDFSQLPVPSEWANFAGLYRGTPWDLFLFAFTTALFIWQISIGIRLVISAHRSKQC